MKATGKKEPKPIKRISLAVGDVMNQATITAEGKTVGLGELWTITALERTKITITSNTGDTIILRRWT